MAQFFLKLPKMGESVAEATLIKWLKEIGDTIEMDESVVEIATDKVDSDVPSEVEGTLIEKRFEEDAVIQVGDIIAVIETTAPVVDVPAAEIQTQVPETNNVEQSPIIETVAPKLLVDEMETLREQVAPKVSYGDRFYSPLVRNIAKKEGVSSDELQHIEGTGKDNRVTKSDILHYIELRKQQEINNPVSSVSFEPVATTNISEPETQSTTTRTTPETEKQEDHPVAPSSEGKDQIIEMSRMGKMISEHMVQSLRTSAHVQSFVEVDVTDLWDWREKEKARFAQRENEKLTFTPLFIKAVINALKDFPILNSAVDGDQIIQKGAINIGMATALPDGHLIVPVIKNADHLNLIGLAKAVNDLAGRARQNTLKPDEVQGGTYTVTNVGNFGSIMGTPIINQPQVGILAIGAIRKMPAVIETPQGDFIAIRKKLILSHSYDHRIINGATGGQFVKNVADYLENWNETMVY